MSTLWDRALAELRGALPSQDFAAWIAGLRSFGSEGEALTVEAPNAFHRNWVHQHFLDRIRSTVETVAGRPVSVRLAVANGGGRPQPAVAPPAPLRAPARSRAIGLQQLTFERFVVGPCNELACAAARAVAETPGRQYNPLFIHGGVGLGKTHLLHAIANAVRVRCGSLRVLAIGAELFINEMVSAVRRQQMEFFHQRFRRIDVLLVDDVQFIAGKERTQEEFLHTFNLLCAAGKQIAVTSDKPPRAVPNLEIGLRSRFEGGMIAEVSRPDRETRHRILASKAALSGLDLPPAVIEYLAERVGATSVRELEGALVRLQASAVLTGRPIDLALAVETVGRAYPEAPERVSAGRVESAVSEALAIDVRLLRSTRRDTQLVFARQVAMYLLRKRVGLSFAAIGERYGRDHTTVLHAVRAIEARRACNPEVRRLVGTLEEKL